MKENKKLLRVLINYDDRAVLELLKLSVESTGKYRILTSDCMQKSMDIAQQFKFDLVITDYNTPLVNGLDLIKNMRSLLSLNRDTPILLISGDHRASIRVSAERFNDVKFIRKPFHLSDFHSLITNVLDNQSFG